LVKLGKVSKFGGINNLAWKYIEANNPSVPNYDQKNSSHIVQIYGNTLRKPLRKGDYYKMTSEEDSEFHHLEINEEGEFGYLITCDFHQKFMTT
jgi:phosphoribosyl 1,2-cyclic phosphodiesterase